MTTTWDVLAMNGQTGEANLLGIRLRRDKGWQPNKHRCYLFIDHEESSYIDCLTVDDHGFCAQIVRFLQERCYNRPIAEIGGLDLSYSF
jgi:hypothetical protein